MTKAQDLEIEITDKMAVHDPCYGDGQILDASPGLWIVEAEFVESFGIRVGKLTAYAKNHKHVSGDKWDSFNFGVDAGLVSFQPLEHHIAADEYRNALDEFWAGPEGSNVDFAIVRNGVWSSTGHGDGCYVADVIYKDGKAIRIEIEFIPDEDDEDDFYIYDDEDENDDEGENDDEENE